MRTKHTSLRIRSQRRHQLALALVAALAAPAALAQSLPQGGTVVNGTASIGTAGTQMTINQSTRGAIIDWGSFSIGSGGTALRFVNHRSSSVSSMPYASQRPEQLSKYAASFRIDAFIIAIQARGSPPRSRS